MHLLPRNIGNIYSMLLIIYFILAVLGLTVKTDAPFFQKEHVGKHSSSLAVVSVPGESYKNDVPEPNGLFEKFKNFCLSKGRSIVNGISELYERFQKWRTSENNPNTPKPMV